MPPSRRNELAAAVKNAFAAGLNDLLYLTAGLALAGGLCVLLLIRRKDFVASSQPDAAPAAGAAALVTQGRDSAPLGARGPH